jgi:hypothetical protein
LVHAPDEPPLLVTDVDMPDMSDARCAGTATDATDLRVLYLTAHSEKLFARTPLGIA